MGLVPLLLLANMVLFLPGWLEQHASAWLIKAWFPALLALNISGLRFAKSINNPYLGGLYLALLIFLLPFWLFVEALSGMRDWPL